MFNDTYKDIEFQENKKYVINQISKDLKPKGIPLSKLNEHLKLKDNLRILGLNHFSTII